MLQDQPKITLAIVLLVTFLTYSGYLYSYLPVQDTAGPVVHDSGKLLWQKYNCSSCHQVYGLGGYLGPDLTNSYTRRGPAYIQAFLASGTNIMPNYHLTEAEIIALTSYLKNIDASGKSDPRTFRTYTNGFINQ
jgi:nitric oxide reductase subunit C